MAAPKSANRQVRNFAWGNFSLGSRAALRGATSALAVGPQNEKCQREGPKPLEEKKLGLLEALRGAVLQGQGLGLVEPKVPDGWFETSKDT